VGSLRTIDTRLFRRRAMPLLLASHCEVRRRGAAYTAALIKCACLLHRPAAAAAAAATVVHAWMSGGAERSHHQSCVSLQLLQSAASRLDLHVDESLLYNSRLCDEFVNNDEALLSSTSSLLFTTLIDKHSGVTTTTTLRLHYDAADSDRLSSSLSFGRRRY